MKTTRPPFATLAASTLMLSLLTLSACNKQTDSTTSAAAPASAASAPANTCTPAPTADQLYQLVAPIALFPDKLVALVLAGSTYPDQIAAANQWVTQNPSVTGSALASAVDPQPWDPSVKQLTAFPAVLSQMAQNASWTSALGQAYACDPTDVMNAIQVMRQRAKSSGNLNSSKQLTVTQATVQAPAEAPPDQGAYLIPPPQQMIAIAPAEPDTVYVPSYDPGTVYGGSEQVYPGYTWSPPAYAYPSGGEVTVGALTFGVGVAVGAAVIGHYGWGWHAWGVDWDGYHHHDHGPSGRGWQRPAVTYNNNVYVSRSTTVINQYGDNRPRPGNEPNRNGGPQGGNFAPHDNGGPGHPPGGNRPPEMGQQPMHQPSGTPMSVPHFTANDTRPGAQPHAGQSWQPGANSAHENGAPREMERSFGGLSREPGQPGLHPGQMPAQNSPQASSFEAGHEAMHPAPNGEAPRANPEGGQPHPVWGNGGDRPSDVPRPSAEQHQASQMPRSEAPPVQHQEAPQQSWQAAHPEQAQPAERHEPAAMPPQHMEQPHFEQPHLQPQEHAQPPAFHPPQPRPPEQHNNPGQHADERHPS